VQTSERSWAEIRRQGALQRSSRLRLDESKGDKKGPVGIAAAVSRRLAARPPIAASPGEARSLKRASSCSATPTSRRTPRWLSGNKDLFMNTVGWLSQQENLISVRAKEAAIAV
jgi:hypothetical protein